MGALDGIRVVDLTRILAGPFCTVLLADMGAEVVKIETANGDPVREQGVVRNGFSWYFAQFNRNKKSVVLDLYSDAATLTWWSKTTARAFLPAWVSTPRNSKRSIRALSSRA